MLLSGSVNMSLQKLSCGVPSSASSSDKNATVSIKLPDSASGLCPSIQVSASSPPVSSSPATLPGSSQLNRFLLVDPPSPTLGRCDPFPINSPPSAHLSASSSFSASNSSQNFASSGLITTDPSSTGTSGVVVVGVIGRLGPEVSGLLDRLLDSRVVSLKSTRWKQWNGSDENLFPPSSAVGPNNIEAKGTNNRHRYWDVEGQDDFIVDGVDGISINRDRFRVEHLAGEKDRAGVARCVRDRDKNSEGNRSDKIKVASEDAETRKREPLRKTREDGGSEGLGKQSSGGVEDDVGIAPSLRKLKYHHDEEKGMLYVEFAWGDLSLDCFMGDSLGAAVADGLPSFLELDEADAMRGLLFMFSVCHVIVLLHEGSRFDPRFLRMLRLLQAAKNSLVPFVKAQVLPGLLPPPSSAIKYPASKPASPSASRPAGRTGMLRRNSSTIALMSGSMPVVFPGLCVPVVLFVCLDDLSDPMPFATNRGDVAPDLSCSASQVESLLSQSGHDCSRHILHGKPVHSGSMLVKSNKVDSGLRKKLQASAEGQIRFLLKKCRTVAGSGEIASVGNPGVLGLGLRVQGSTGSFRETFQGMGGGVSLFVLDPSRAVVLLDKSAIGQADALECAANEIEAIVCKQEYHGWSLDLDSSHILAEDVQAVKDFICRQADILRGKGGISNNSAGGPAGVGMVAAAAAAAAASAASGGACGPAKVACSPPELPTFSAWLSASRSLAKALSTKLLGKIEHLAEDKLSHDVGMVSKKGGPGPTASTGISGSSIKTMGNIDATLLCLESASDVDMKFSAAWCKRVLVTAQEAYLSGLPSRYSTSCHKSQLDKSLRLFYSKVRGRAVPFYAEKLRHECEAIWHSGRQLCDAKSLKGNPCIHQVHITDKIYANGVINQITRKGEPSKRVFKPHSSGVVFLHACACGRSRKLRNDPFDFETANISFFRFPSCDDLLPSLIVGNSQGDIRRGGSSWNLVRLGNSRYYQPAVGLNQSGFCPKQNYLSFLGIPVEHGTVETQDGTVVSLPEEMAEFMHLNKVRTSQDTRIATTPDLLTTLPEFLANPSGVSLHGKVEGRLIPDGVHTSSIEFGSSKPKGRVGDAISRPSCGNVSAPGVNHAENCHGGPRFAGGLDGHYSCSMRDLNNCEQREFLDSVTEHIHLYIGFEHECPRGHRFFLSLEQSKKTGLSRSSIVDGTALGEQEKDNAMWGFGPKLQNQDMTCGKAPLSWTINQEPCPLEERCTKSSKLPPIFCYQPKLEERKLAAGGSQRRRVRNGYGDGYSLLNSNLPIYMHCPHCKIQDEKKTTYKGIVFGGTISQLQRIFVVTPAEPLILASCPVVEFEDSSKNGRTIIEFNQGKPIVLPPDSFLSLRLPFVYYAQKEGAPHKPLLVEQSRPEHCAWLVRNTAVYVLSQGNLNY